MPHKRDSIPAAIDDYPSVLKQFAQFIDNLKGLNIPSLAVAEYDASDPSRVSLRFLGDLFILRTRMGIDENGHGVAFFECLKADDNGEYSLARKCFVSNDGIVLFEGGAAPEVVGIAEGSRTIFKELIASVLLTDTPAHKGFLRTMPPKQN